MATLSRGVVNLAATMSNILPILKKAKMMPASQWQHVLVPVTSYRQTYGRWSLARRHVALLRICRMQHMRDWGSKITIQRLEG